MLSNNDKYHPEQALKRITEQELQIPTKIDSQVVLQLLIAKGIVSIEEINDMRKKVSALPKYKTTLDSLLLEKQAMEAAINNSEEYLMALMNAKLNGDIK